jgi:hypothetical protein
MPSSVLPRCFAAQDWVLVLFCRSLAVSGCNNLTATGLETAAYNLRLTRLEADDLPGAGEGVAAIVANMPLLAASASPGNPATARWAPHSVMRVAYEWDCHDHLFSRQRYVSTHAALAPGCSRSAPAAAG